MLPAERLTSWLLAVAGALLRPAPPLAPAAPRPDGHGPRTGKQGRPGPDPSASCSTPNGPGASPPPPCAVASTTATTTPTTSSPRPGACGSGAWTGPLGRPQRFLPPRPAGLRRSAHPGGDLARPGAPAPSAIEGRLSRLARPGGRLAHARPEERPGPPDTGPPWEAFVLDAVREVPLPDLWLYGEPYPTLNAVILEPEEHASLVALTERFATIFHKAVRALQRDAGACSAWASPGWRWSCWIGRPRTSRSSWGASTSPWTPAGPGRCWSTTPTPPPGRGRRWPWKGRPAAPAGTASRRRRAKGPRAAAGAGGHRPAPGRGRAPGLRPGPGRAAGRGALGIVTDAGYAEDLSQAVFLHRHLAPALARRGLRTRYADVDNLSLSRGPAAPPGAPPGRPLPLLPVRDAPGPAGVRRPLRRRRGRAGAPAQRLAGAAGPEQGAAGLAVGPPRRRDPLHRPRAAGDRGPPPPGVVDRRAAAGERREGLVLKQAFGREGEEVYFGDRLSDADWARCREWGSYVCQRRVDVPPLDAAVSTAAGAETQTLWPAVGSFTARGGGPATTPAWGGPSQTPAPATCPPSSHAPRAAGRPRPADPLS